MIGNEIHALATKLWPIPRSLTGDGVRETLRLLKAEIGEMTLHEVKSGTHAFDWTVPQEWRVNEAYILAPDGQRICDFQANNLHLVGYSVPFKGKLNLQDLQSHLYSLPDQPDAIPYITSYYSERWGFCLSDSQRTALPEGEYTVVVDTELFDGSLTYGEILVPGETKKEVFLSTYVCHPSMANNELSGPAVVAFLAKKILAMTDRYYSYRIVFIPETIGSITYISRNLSAMKENIVAGFNVSCVGDNRAYSYLPSRNGNTISDRVAQHVLSHVDRDYVTYTWTDRGSDERQYCAPGVDLPIASIMRTKFGKYPEYHTSLDNLENVVTPEGLTGGYTALAKAIDVLEQNTKPNSVHFCEPQLGKRGLYPTLSTKDTRQQVALMMDIISWSDGSNSVLEIANKCGVAFDEVASLVNKLVAADVLTVGRD